MQPINHIFLLLSVLDGVSNYKQLFGLTFTEGLYLLGAAIMNLGDKILNNFWKLNQGKIEFLVLEPEGGEMTFKSFFQGVFGV